MAQDSFRGRNKLNNKEQEEVPHHDDTWSKRAGQKGEKSSKEETAHKCEAYTSGYVHYCASPAMMRMTQPLRGSPIRQIRFLTCVSSALLALGDAISEHGEEPDLVVVIHLCDFRPNSEPFSTEEFKRIFITRCVQKVRGCLEDYRL